MQTNTFFIFRLLLFFFITSNLHAQTLAPKNQKLFGGSGGERIYTIKPTTDNGLIFAGVTNSWLGDGDVDDLFRRQNGRFPQVDGNNDVWVVKLASDYKPFNGSASLAAVNSTMRRVFYKLWTEII